MNDPTIATELPETRTIEPSGATDEIRYVLNTTPPAVEAPIDGAAGLQHAEVGAPQSGHPAGTGGLSDEVIDNADDQLPDPSDSTVRGGKVGQESKRGAY